MHEQTSFRLPVALAQALDRRARETGVPKSQLVREALERYLGAAEPPGPDQVRERSAPYLGALELDPAPGHAGPDAIAGLIRERNWRP